MPINAGVACWDKRPAVLVVAAGHLPAQCGLKPRSRTRTLAHRTPLSASRSRPSFPRRARRAAGRGSCKGRSQSGGDLGNGQRPRHLGCCPTGGPGGCCCDTCGIHVSRVDGEVYGPEKDGLRERSREPR